MSLFEEWVRYETRRQFFSRGASAVGWAALGSLAGHRAIRRPDAAGRARRSRIWPISPRKAKHVIYLHMVGGPSQMDLYDYKPKMNEWYDKDLPDRSARASA